MPLGGVDLAADLAELWRSGRYRIPAVQHDLETARAAVPTDVTSLCARTPGLGISDNGPGPAIDTLLGLLATALGGTAETLAAVGGNLVALAEDYRDTDAACATAFDRKTAAIAAEEGHAA